MRQPNLIFYYARPEVGRYADRFARYVFFEIHPANFIGTATRPDVDREPQPNSDAGYDDTANSLWLAWYICQTKEVQALDRHQAKIMASELLEHRGRVTALGELPASPPELTHFTPMDMRFASNEDLNSLADYYFEEETSFIAWHVATSQADSSAPSARQVRELARGILHGAGHVIEYPSPQCREVRNVLVPSQSMKLALMEEIGAAVRDLACIGNLDEWVNLKTDLSEFGIPFPPITKADFAETNPVDALVPMGLKLTGAPSSSASSP